jgi:hypothetical protein
LGDRAHPSGWGLTLVPPRNGNFRNFRIFRYRYPITGLEVSEVSEISEGRRQTPVGLVVGISAISASVLPIADCSARRPDPGTQEYLRTAIGPPKRVSASFRRFPPLCDIVGEGRIS